MPPTEPDARSPEAEAGALLRALPGYLWDGEALPVPVEDIADTYFGLRVCERDDLGSVPGAPALPGGETLSGMLLVAAREIWVNGQEAREWPGRRRFTIGHELGHWCLHREPGGDVFCRLHAPALELPELADRDIEAEASLFAGALLFPEPLVRREHERLGGDLEALRERFGASKVATKRAVFRAVRGPAVRAVAPSLVCCFWDDAGYEAWRSAHRDDGYVLNDDLGDPAGARLHRLSCNYLDRAVQPGQPPRTADPKWLSLDAGELRAAFLEAKACGRCKPEPLCG